MPDGPHTGARIRRARKLLRMTQQELADKVGVSRTTVDAWENERSYPKRYDVALEQALGITLDDGPPPGIVPEYEWERLLMLDETLPLAERVQIIEVTRRARAGGGPAPVPRPGAGGGRGAREPRTA